MRIYWFLVEKPIELELLWQDHPNARYHELAVVILDPTINALS